MLTSPLHTSAITTASSRVSESASARLGGSAITTQRTTAQGSTGQRIRRMQYSLYRLAQGWRGGGVLLCMRAPPRPPRVSVFSPSPPSVVVDQRREKPGEAERSRREKPGEAERSRREKPGEQEEQQEAMGGERKAEGRQAHSPEATLLRLRAAPELRATHAATCGGAQSSVAAAVSAAAHPRQVFIGR